MTTVTLVAMIIIIKQHEQVCDMLFYFIILYTFVFCCRSWSS